MRRYTIKDFNRDFPNDTACLDWLFRFRHPGGRVKCNSPKCQGRMRKHHPVVGRRSYACAYCGHHVYPTAGTIFHKSPTPLRLWFYATYLMAQTRCGISAKQIQRETGVTYKTAWRMFNRIRKLMAQDKEPFGGTVEVDETYIGGRRRFASRQDAAKNWSQYKEVVAGHVERGGSVRALHLPEGTAQALVPLVREYVLPASTVYTDELPAYAVLHREGYEHKRVHHAAKVYVQGDVHTNTIDGFWALLKHGLRGVYHGVSAKYLQAYLDEYAFRYNHRKDEIPMFSTILSRISTAD